MGIVLAIHESLHLPITHSTLYHSQKTSLVRAQLYKFDYSSVNKATYGCIVIRVSIDVVQEII